MLLTVIIVSYNTKALTLATIESALASISRSKKLRNSAETIVVDNNSSDGSIEELEKICQKQKHFHLILNKDNKGFAAANNQAILEAAGDFVLLLNSDTIVQTDALECLVDTFETYFDEHGDTSRLGIVAAQLLNQDGTVQHQGGSFPTLFSLATQMLLLDDIPLIGKFLPSTQHTGRSGRAPQTRSLHLQDWVGGTAMMVDHRLFSEIDMFDENIFMYGEDIEFCMRAKFHLWNIAIQPNAKITHLGSASSSSRNAIIGELKGYLYIWAKHKPLWQRSFAKSLVMIGVVLRIVLFGTMINDSHRAAIYKEAYQVLKPL